LNSDVEFQGMEEGISLFQSLPKILGSAAFGGQAEIEGAETGAGGTSTTGAGRFSTTALVVTLTSAIRVGISLQASH
jgi:hypothetical protein